MTYAELYALYRLAFEHFDHARGGRVSEARALPAIARAIVEFAETDAENGIALRSRAEFEACLAAGAGALAPLGLRAA